MKKRFGSVMIFVLTFWGERCWAQQAQSPTVNLSPGVNLTVTVGSGITFTASGGSGNGDYNWFGAAAGTGASNLVIFKEPGNQTVVVYRSGDSKYSASNAASIVVTVVALVPVSTIVSPFPASVATTPVSVAPAPVAVTPAPVAVTPAPVAVTPAPVAVTPAPVAVTLVATTPDPVAVPPPKHTPAASNAASKVKQQTPLTLVANSAGAGVSSSVPMNTTVNFTATGGESTGEYNWGGAASGKGTSKSLNLTTVGSVAVSVYKSGDDRYAPSDVARITVNVASPTVASSPPVSSSVVTTNDNSGVTNTAGTGSNAGSTSGTQKLQAGNDLGQSTTYVNLNAPVFNSSKLLTDGMKVTVAFTLDSTSNQTAYVHDAVCAIYGGVFDVYFHPIAGTDYTHRQAVLPNGDPDVNAPELFPVSGDRGQWNDLRYFDDPTSIFPNPIPWGGEKDTLGASNEIVATAEYNFQQDLKNGLGLVYYKDGIGPEGIEGTNGTINSIGLGAGAYAGFGVDGSLYNAQGTGAYRVEELISEKWLDAGLRGIMFPSTSPSTMEKSAFFPALTTNFSMVLTNVNSTAGKPVNLTLNFTFVEPIGGARHLIGRTSLFGFSAGF